MRLEFWRAFKDYMAGRSRVRCATATSEDWMNHGADLNGGSLFSVQRTRLREIGVQFALDDATAETIYSYLESRRPEIDAAFPEGLRWHDPAGRRTSLIEIRRSADTSEPRAWPDHFAWLHELLERFQDVLWPIVGRVPAVGEPRRWDEVSFFMELRHLNPTSVEPAEALLHWARHHTPNIYWGHGRQTGSCTPRLTIRGTHYQLFTFATGGTLTLRFIDLKKTEPFDRADLRLKIVQSLNEARFLALPPTVIDHRSALPLPLFADREVRHGLLTAAEAFVRRCRSSFS